MNDVYEPSWEAWEVWLTQQEEERTKRKRLEQHKVWVGKLLDSAEGGSSMLHNITEPRPWRGGVHKNKETRLEEALAGQYTRTSKW